MLENFTNDYDHQNCMKKRPVIGIDQPPARFWDSFGDGCSGAQMDLYPYEGGTKSFASLDANTDFKGQKLNNNWIDSMWIPPNMSADLYAWGNFEHDHGKFNFEDSDYGTGIFNNIGNPWKGIGANDADSVQLTINKNWHKHLFDCCNGTISDENQCGKFVPNSANCTDPKIITRGGCDINQKDKMSDECKAFFRKNPDYANAQKYKFCKEHLNDPWCSCINVEADPQYKLFLENVKETYGITPPPECSAFGRCTTGQDLDNIYLIDKPPAVCPPIDVKQIINKITGNNNVLNTTQVQTSNGKGGNTGNAEESSNLQLIIIILAIFSFVILIVVFVMRKMNSSKLLLERDGK